MKNKCYSLFSALALSICMLTSLAGKAQITLGYFPFNYGEVQLTSPQEYLLFADFRMETNSFISNLNMELGGAINLRRAAQYNLYIGVGFRINPFVETTNLSGYYFPVGVRWRPITSIPKLGVVFELSPLLYESVVGGLAIRSKLGVSYAF